MYETVFDASQRAYAWWQYAPLLLWSIVPLMGLWVWRMYFKPSRQREAKLRSSCAVLALALVACLPISVVAITYYNYLQALSLLQHNNAAVVEGPVVDFTPMPYDGHSKENFTVKGVQFKYSDYGVSQGFNKTSSHGGPIHEGLYVRIHYTYLFGDPSDPTILKLEIKR